MTTDLTNVIRWNQLRRGCHDAGLELTVLEEPAQGVLIVPLDDLNPHTFTAISLDQVAAYLAGWQARNL